MKHYFDENDMYNDDAQRVLQDIYTFLYGLYDHEISKGFSVRELTYLVANEAGQVCAETILRTRAERAVKKF